MNKIFAFLNYLYTPVINTKRRDYIPSCSLLRGVVPTSRVARRKLIQQVKKIQEDQAQTKENWYLKCLKSKVKEDSVYVICDPNDVRFYYNLRADLVPEEPTGKNRIINYVS